jgi:Xaa-Pro aminopeptidase
MHAIKPSEFKKRRKQIAKIIGSDSIAIIKAKDACIRNGDAEYKYRPDSNFYYLSGCDEAEALMLICPDNAAGDDILLCRKIDPKHEIWNGPMLGLDAAVTQLAFDYSYDIEDLDKVIPELMQGRDKVYFMLGADSEFDKKIVYWTNKVKKEKWAKSCAPHELISLKPYLDDMRVYKSKDEIKCMQESADIAATAHVAMMKACRVGMYEYNLAAHYYKNIMDHNSSASYLPIIGGGNNACVLHYTNNNCLLNDGDMVLIDAGAECDYYASDITRTFPVNGRFSAAQSEIYQVVLAAHSAAIEKVQPGNHWNEPHEAAVRVITQGLLDLGLLKGAIEELLEDHSYAHFYMHKTGHWLGLDVHDCGEYSIDGLWVELEANMVLTVEPGIYISKQADVPKKYRGIGVRIEDDVLVTKDGNKILSNKIPRTLDEIENIMRQSI